MKARYVVWVTLLATPSVAFGQGAEDWRASFAAGEEARASGDVAGYATGMAAAATTMPVGHLNRPFVQYHAARAAALRGRDDEAVRWLRTAWDEGIESLMISFAPFDDAFGTIKESAAFKSVMALPAQMELDVRRLGDGVHLIQGAGANVVAHIGPDGVLLVDTGYGPALPALREALAAVGGEGIDLLVVTHPHEDHMGGSADLGAEARILAHPGTTAAMIEPYVFMEGVSMPPKPAIALPDTEVATDTTFSFNGETVVIVPTPAHTSGDLSIYFREAHVALLGDTYLAGNPMMFPGTEDPDGFLDRLEAFLDTMHAETVVIGGHEEPSDLAAVRHQIEESRACMALVRAALAEGLTMEATAERAVDRFPPQWVAFFYGVFVQGAG